MAKNKGGLLVLFGAIIGALTALFFSTTEEGETKDAVKQRVKEAKSKLKEVREGDTVEEIFGKKSEDVVKIFREAKDSLAEKLGELKESFDAIDKKKYMSAVTEVTDELKKNSKITKAQLTKMKKYLEEDYKKLAATKPEKKS